MTGSDVSDFNRRNIEEFRANHGRIGGQFEGAPVLLLHSIGARSGEERVSPMMYLPDRDRYLVFASAAGADRNPAWYWNLVANPNASMMAGARRLGSSCTSPANAAPITTQGIASEKIPQKTWKKSRILS